MDARFQRATDSQHKRTPIVSSMYSRSKGSPLRQAHAKETTPQMLEIEQSAVKNEIRRGQELLQQIRSKENQLASRIRQSGHQYSRLTPFDASQYLLESPTNQIDTKQLLSGHSYHSQTSSLGFLREVPVQENQLKNIQRSRHSPLREAKPATTSSNFQEQQVELANGSQQVHQLQFLEKLQKDNETLQKRLQLVVAELDRVMNERDRVQQKFQSILGQTNECQIEIQEIEQEDDGFKQGQDQLLQQRETNKVLRQTISQAERSRIETVKQLRIVQNQRERQVADCEDLAADFDHRTAILQEIGQNKDLLQGKINQIQVEIQTLKAQGITDERQNYEKQIIIDVLSEERNNLMLKLEELSQTYEQIVHDLTQDKLKMEAHEKFQRQLLASQTMFTSINSMVRMRKQQALNEFFLYCRFDERCHRSLLSFSIILEKIGTFKQSLAIKLWYQKVFKPLTIQRQTKIAGYTNFTQTLKQIMFSRWRSAFLGLKQDQKEYRLGLYKLLSIQRKQVKNDRNRMMMIWREDSKLQSQKARILNSVTVRTSNRLLRNGLYKWLEYCLDYKALVRQHVLASKLSNQRRKLVILSSFRETVVAQREKRFNKLNYLLKAWKSWIARRKYIKVQAKKLATLKFVMRDRLLASCFQQLRLEKEEQKLVLMQETWTDRVEPDILQLTEEIRTISTKELQVKKIRSMLCLSKAARKHLQSYFEHWRRYNEVVNQKLDKNLRAIILRKYRQTLQQALARLRNSKQIQKLGYQQDVVESEQLNQIDLQNTIISLTDQVNTEQFKLAYQQRLMLQHAISIFNSRTCRRGIQKWQSNCRSLASLQKAATALSDRIKTAMRRSCWNHYQQQIVLCRKQDKDEATIEKRRQLRLWRTKRKFFDAIYLFFIQFRDQQTYWKITLTNLEVCLKRKGLRRWIEQGNLKRQQQLQISQNMETFSFDEINTKLGQSVTELQVSTDVNTELFIQLKDQGQRILSNTFARCYYIRIGHGFRKWAEATKFVKHRESIINRTVQHKLKAQFYVLSAAWKNWVAHVRIKETQASIVYVQLKNEEKNQLINFQRQTHLETADQLSQLTETEANKQRLKANHNQIAIQIATSKALNNFYQSRLRFIFQQWVGFFRRQKHFAQAITRVITKSLWQHGFDRIRAEYQADVKQELQKTHLVAMRRLYWQKNVGRTVQLWKDRLRNQDHQSIAFTNKAIEVATDNFQSKVIQIREINQQQLFTQQKTKIIKQTLKAWQNVKQWRKSMRVSAEKLRESQKTESIKKALWLWQARKEMTLLATMKTKKFELKSQQIYKTAVLKAIRRRCQAVKVFCFKLSLLGYKFDQLSQQNSFQQILIFSKNKHSTDKHIMTHSANQLGHILHSLFIRNQQLHLNKLKKNHLRLQQQDAKLKSLVGNAQSRRQRSFFMRWRDNTHYLATVEDVNLQGPVVEEVLDAQADFSNCLNFMHDQGYTKIQIQQANEFAAQSSTSLISRSVARIKHYTEKDDLYLKPKMFDRWRFYVKMRKLVRYLLRSVENRLVPVKADLGVAFGRWKSKQVDSNRVLNGLDRVQLIIRSCKNEENLRIKDQDGQRKELQIIQMSFERDELIDNYVRGQKLGIAVGRDNMQRAIAKSMSSLSDNCQKQKRSQIESVLQRNIELIAGLKDKIMHLEFDNSTLASDNEELRQFSLDGFEIARNASLLSNEREKLSIDLADKAKTIKRLLDEHDQLERSLRESQYKTENLIQTTLNQRQSFERQPSPQMR